MILSGKEIKRRLDKEIIIRPFHDKQLGPNSYNLKLFHELVVYKDTVLDMKKKHETETIIMPESGFMLQPGTLYLARTVEYTSTNHLVPMLEGRSSIGRLGIFVHITAGFGDVGFSGYWTLEIFCAQPVIIYPNVEICQIFYHTLEGDFIPYNSNKYQHNTGTQPSLLYKELINL